MDNYRKKPVVIKAKQWFVMGDHPEVQPFPNELMTLRVGGNTELVTRCEQCGLPYADHGKMETLESPDGYMHRVCPGDWIIQGVHGEYYSCKPGIFAETYERADD